MSLLDVEKKLYEKDENKDLAKHADSEFDARSRLADSSKISFAPEDAWEEKKKGLDKNQKRAIKYGVIFLAVILLIVAIAVVFYRLKQASFSEDKVVVAINGPKEVQSGTAMTYEINYKNENQATLKDAKLNINFPDNFKPEDNPSFLSEGPSNGRFELGEVKGGAEGKIIFRAKAFSPKGSLIYIKADFSYTPSTFNSQFIVRDQLGINIISFPVTVEVLAPQNLASGDEIEYFISYKNTGEEDFENAKLRVSYPEGFTLSNAEPAASEGDNIWYIGHLSVAEEGKIVIKGKLEGSKDDTRVLRVELGSLEEGQFVSYNNESVSTKIEASPLVISQTVNGLTDYVAKAGEELNFEIAYRNDGSIGLRDVIVTEKVESSILDFGSLKLKKGAYSSSDSTIIWKASDFSELANLAPGEEGKIDFSIKIKDVIPVTNTNDKNFVISSIAKIDSPDIQTPIDSNKIISGNKIDIKLKTKIGLSVKGYYEDSQIKNTGPIPPVVDSETTYTLHWSVMNVSNDIINAKVEAILPTGVVMTGAKYPEDSNLTYNERTNMLVWQIGNLPAGTGIIVPEKEIAFQVKIKPAINQIGSGVDLLEAATLSGQDSFVNEDTFIKADAKSNDLKEDASIGEKYKVQPASP
ncbi:MAG TPA: hypothetical protein VF390_02775 [Patescibacteria group bacterium]